MAILHSAQHAIAAGVVGGLNFGIDRSLLVDGDLTTLTAAKAAVDADAAKLHSSQAMFGERVKASLDKVDDLVSGYTTGGSATAANTLVDPGCRDRFLIL